MSNATIAPNLERRILNAPQLEIRAASDGAPLITGYAAVFNQPSLIMADWFTGDFREIVAPGAFAKTLKDGADVRALVNHNPDFVLGRTKSNTLSLKEDDRGLWMEIKPPATRWADDLITTMRRGDMDGSSFGFQIVRDRWGTGKTDDGDVIDERWVLEARLFDVSVVTFPAYPQTESHVRSLFGAAGLDIDAISRAVIRSQRGLSLSQRDREAIETAINKLRSYLPELPPTPEPVVPNHPGEAADSAPNSRQDDAAVHPLSFYRDWLNRVESKLSEVDNGPGEGARTARRTAE